MSTYLKIFLSIIFFTLSTVAQAAKENKYDKLISRCSDWPSGRIIAAGDKYLAAGDSEKALVMYIMVCNRTDSPLTAEEVRTRVAAHLKAGDVYYDSGNYSKAQMFYVEGLKAGEADAAKPHVAVLYKNMGNVHCMFQDYEKGIYLYKAGIKEGEAANDNETLYKIYQNLIGAYIYINDPATARQYYDKAGKTPHKVTKITKFMDGYTHALLVKAEGRLGRAVEEFKHLAAYADTAGIDPRYECSAYKEAYEIYEKMGDGNSALEYADRCKTLAESSGLTHMFVNTYKQLSDIYARRGDTGKALRLKSLYVDIKDSVFNIREFDMAKNQQFMYEMEKVERDIALLNQDKERRAQVIKRQRLIIVCTMTVIIIVSLLLLYVYRQKRQLAESYRSLYQLNRQLADNDRTAKAMQKRQTDEITTLRARLEHDSADGESLKADVRPEDTPRADAESRYKGSSLNDGQREKLAEAITEVMDNSEEFCRPDFSLDMLAGLVSSNSNYVSQTINAVYNKNFSNYINEYRIRLACTRLSDPKYCGSYTIRSIGESVGFGAYGTFINVFKRVTGMTPSLYQKMALEEQAGASKTVHDS